MEKFWDLNLNSDTKTNILQNPFQPTCIELNKPAKLFSAQESLWNKPFWFPPTDYDWTENEFRKTEA